MDVEYNYIKAAAIQREYCRSKELPHFAPISGRCYECDKNIYLPYKHKDGTVTGISVRDAARQLVTCCPHCHRTFVD